MCSTILVRSLFFFFQAEDGIRDLIVTGVQTCALPILRWAEVPGVVSAFYRVIVAGAVLIPWAGFAKVTARKRSDRVSARPEIGRASCRERCRSRWSPYH